jgi:hypothetical protein
MYSCCCYDFCCLLVFKFSSTKSCQVAVKFLGCRESVPPTPAPTRSRTPNNAVTYTIANANSISTAHIPVYTITKPIATNTNLAANRDCRVQSLCEQYLQLE